VKGRTSVAPDDVAIHFFSRDSDGASRRLTPKIDADGRLDAWPEGFFDQFDQALAALL
jgi:predicted ATPase